MKAFSIRSRLIFWIGFIVTLLLSFGSYMIYRTARSMLYQQIDQNLSSVLSLQVLELEVVDGQLYHEWLLDIEKDERRSVSEYVQVWELQTGSTTRSPALGDADLPLLDTGGDRESFSDFILPDGHHARVIGKRTLPVMEAEAGTKTPVESFYMAIALDVENAEHALGRLAGTLLLGLAFSLLISIVTIRVVITLSFRPLERLEQLIHQTDVNNPKAIFEVPEGLPIEVGGLVGRYRDLFLRISRVREREREFSGNVAHELRTPLAGVEATLEQALAVERDAGDYKNRITDALRVTDKMRGLINRLMWFSRLYNGSESVQLSGVDLQQVVETRLSIMEDELLAKQLNQIVTFEPDLGLIETDETLVGILMNNLIGNAISHSGAKSDLSVAIRRAKGAVIVEISNTCQHFDRTDLEIIFQPFHRGDLARSGDSEHSGIGLALSQEIANLLRLQLKVAYNDDCVFTVQVVFPEKA